MSHSYIFGRNYYVVRGDTSKLTSHRIKLLQELDNPLFCLALQMLCQHLYVGIQHTCRFLCGQHKRHWRETMDQAKKEGEDDLEIRDSENEEVQREQSQVMVDRRPMHTGKQNRNRFCQLCYLRHSWQLFAISIPTSTPTSFPCPPSTSWKSRNTLSSHHILG